MTRLNHPNFEGWSVEVDDREVASYTAQGWKPAKTDPAPVPDTEKPKASGDKSSTKGDK